MTNACDIDHVSREVTIEQINLIVDQIDKLYDNTAKTVLIVKYDTTNNTMDESNTVSLTMQIYLDSKMLLNLTLKRVHLSNKATM